MSAFKFTRKDGYICIALALITLALYSRMFHADFVVTDDDQYINSNPQVLSGLNWAAIKWAFTTGYAANWHPLTWISHALDIQLYGLNASRHHQTNILLHTCSTVLLFLLLRALTGNVWRCAMVAALFGWHPFHVESVAWIAERKDVLSTFFWMLTVLAYVAYAREGGGWRYLLVTFLYVLALLSKPMVVTLPCVLLLLDFWPLGRIAGWKWEDKTAGVNADSNKSSLTLAQAVIEKWPWFALSAICCFITYKVQQAGGTTGLLRTSFSMRMFNVLIAYCRYVTKMFYPTHLAIFYPYDKSPAVWKIIGAAFFLIAVTFVTAKSWRKRPYLLFGWLFFLGTLVPAIGIVQVGQQSMADRYSYVPSIGICIAVVWLVSEFCATRPNLTSPLALAAIAVLGACGIATWKQEAHWQNYRAAYAHALKVIENNAVAEYNYGYSFELEKNYPEAIKHYKEAVRINPLYYNAENGIGLCLAAQGKHVEATNYYVQTIRMAAPFWKAHFNYGLSLEALGDPNGALREFKEAARLEPEEPKCHFKIGQVLLTLNSPVEAKPELEQAVKLAPDLFFLHSAYAVVLKTTGDFETAIAEYETALKISPNDAMSLNNLAWLRATCSRDDLRNGAEAVRLAQRACDLTANNDPVMLGTLAAAYAEAGQFPDAIAMAQRGHDIADARGMKELGKKTGELLALYQAGKPFHETTQPSKSVGTK